MLLHHHRSWKRDIGYSLLKLAICMLVACGLLFVFAGHFWPTVLIWVILVFNVVMFAWKIAGLARSREDFSCTLNDQHLECHVPTRSEGDSFRIALDDIAEIHRDSSDEGSPRIRLHTQDGRALWLTSNFGNPAKRILRLIREMRPDIPMIED